MTEYVTPLAYLLAAGLFILSLKWLSTPVTARRGVFAGAIGMGLAIIGTLIQHESSTYTPILIAFALGSIVGVPLAMVPLTAVPQRTALSHAFGALAATLVGTAEYYHKVHSVDGLSHFTMFALVLEVLLGALTTTGSLMACGKLQEILPTRPITYKNQNFVNLGILAGAIIVGGILVARPETTWLFPILIILSATFGVMLIIPIGGSDMPTVISLLNSYAGLSAVAMGFVLDNRLLMIAGALDGSSGLILSIIMCKAMNRSFTNVLFGAFGQVQTGGVASMEGKTVRPTTIEDAAALLENAQTVVVVPGYGMAVAQAQHKVRELFDLLSKRGVNMEFAIHPVAGRMPGHMNVLLAEADIPYDKLKEMEEINPEMSQVDVVLVIGANDVTNPAARHDKASPIYGMPIIDVDKARNILVIKRGMSPGFAGVDNELYYDPKCAMLFGDAKSVVSGLVTAVKESGA